MKFKPNKFPSQRTHPDWELWEGVGCSPSYFVYVQQDLINLLTLNTQRSERANREFRLILASAMREMMSF